MRLIDELRVEHVLIERVAGSLRTFVALRARGEGEPRDGEGFLLFLRVFSAGYHHAREENSLFPALVHQAELPAEAGPIASFLAQHGEMAETLEEMAPLLAADPMPPNARETLVDLATMYTRALWQHIDAENSALFPESEQRLRRSGVPELSSRAPTDAESEARTEGERLARLYPPTDDPGAIRGEGCAICPSLGTTCRGVEREWWGEAEWEEFSDHLG